MKKKYIFVLPFLLLILYGCPQSYTDEEFVTNKTTQLTSNIIGVTGEVLDEPYVEVEYTIFENGKNVAKSEMLSPPFYIGGNKVIVSYDSLNFVQSEKKVLGGIRLVKPDYCKSGSHYLKIKNHSDKPIEYFIAGTQPIIYEKYVDSYGLKTPEGIDLQKFIKSSPVPIFNDAPIYYLLFPEKRPLKDGFIRRTTKWTEKKDQVIIEEVTAKRIKFTGDNCGDLKINPPWSIEQVMAIYKKEYLKNSETKMYMNYNDAGPVHPKRLAEAETNNDYGGTKRQILYGKIASRETLQNTGQIWILNTPYYGIYRDEF